MLMQIDEFKEALPAKLRNSVNQQTLNNINQILSEPEMYEYYRNNFLSYSHVLANSRNSIEEYVNAIKYCSFKIAGFNNKEAYMRTFKTRYQAHVANGVSEKDIASYISAYNKTKLVTSILEHAYIPMWLLNQDAVQLAINTQIAVMKDPDASDKNKIDAANSILNHLKPPEKNKIELDIGIKQDVSMINELRNVVSNMVDVQREAIESGVHSVKYIAESKIIDAEEVK